MTEPASERLGRDDANQKVQDVLRSYLQRAEVRLSTMHRIAGTFISGAGLLLLLPIFLKDVLASIIGVFILSLNSSPPLGTRTTAVLHAVPVMIAFVIPLYSLYLLLRELVLFYFSANIPEPAEKQGAPFHPRFALTAIPFPDDVGEAEKKAIRAEQFQSPLINFIMPHDKREKRWMDSLMSTPEGQSVALPESDWLSVDDRKTKDFSNLRLLFGLAGAYDRTTLQEVAKTELSLIRHNLLLRRLVLRYLKAFILFIWTSCVLFVLVPLFVNQDVKQNMSNIGIALLIWSSSVPFWVRAPIRWVYREFDQNSPDRTRDPHLNQFEKQVSWVCLFATTVGAFTTVRYYHAGWGAWTYAIAAAAWIFNVICIARSYGTLESAAVRWI